MRQLIALVFATLVAVAAPLAQNPLDGMSAEELQELLEEYDRQIELLEQRERENDADIETIDGMIEDIDRTLEQYAPYTNFAPIPLLGVDEPPPPPPAPTESAPAPAETPQTQVTLPVAGVPPGDPLGFNSWCFNILFNLGVRHGFADEAQRDLAGFAMADASDRILKLSQAAGMDGDLRDGYDKAMFEATIAPAAAVAGGSASYAQKRSFDACLAKGVRGVRYMDIFFEPGGRGSDMIWCRSTFGIFNERQMVGGGPERAGRAQRAETQLNLWAETIPPYIGIPPSDWAVLERGYYFRSLVQVEAFQWTEGDKSRFEADYEICFPMEALVLADDRPEPPPMSADRPALTSPGWDYPLSFEFRFNAWCYGAMNHLSDVGVPSGSTLTGAEAGDLVGDLHLRLLMEANAVGLSSDMLAEMEVESYHEAVFEFGRSTRGNGDRPTSYSYNFCASSVLDIGGLLDLDNMEAVIDSLTVPAPAPDAEFNDAVWCLAGLERVLGSETRREERQALQQGLNWFGSEAARLGRALGLSNEVMMGRLTDMKPVVESEIRTRRLEDGKLMIANCLERGLGYSDIFYDWVDPE